MPTIDEISPAYVGDDRISLTLDPSSTPRSLVPIQVNVSYAAAEPEGIELPLELLISGDNTHVRSVFRQAAPTSVVFVPEGAGPHLVLLRELAHNRYVGRLVIDVAGDALQTTAASPV